MEQVSPDKPKGQEPVRNESWRMFNRISRSYDLVNRLLSFGIDVRWRRRMARQLPAGEKLRVLDLATGTADGIRNVPDVPRVLGEMCRVLKPGGRALILEFSLPENGLVRAVHLLYLRGLLPRIGGMISGDVEAYRYLNRTIEAFPYGDAFCELMRNAGFIQVASTPLSFGIATIYQGDRAAG